MVTPCGTCFGHFRRDPPRDPPRDPLRDPLRDPPGGLGGGPEKDLEERRQQGPQAIAVLAPKAVTSALAHEATPRKEQAHHRVSRRAFESIAAEHKVSGLPLDYV